MPCTRDDGNFLSNCAKSSKSWDYARDKAKAVVGSPFKLSWMYCLPPKSHSHITNSSNDYPYHPIQASLHPSATSLAPAK